MRALALIFLTSCYSPDIKDGQFTCDDGVACPSGFLCVCHSCVKNPSNMTCSDGGEDLSGVDLAGEDLSVGDLANADLTVPIDMSVKPGDMASLPGCSSGQRAPDDPGLALIAFCPAAWTVPGIHPSPLTPCNRVVDGTGKNGATNCSTEDNCATNWHVCVDETEVSAKGLTQKTDCAALQAFYVSAQKGGPPASPGPPVCDNSAYHTVFGCGHIVQVGGAPNCSLFNAALLNPPNGSDNCSSSTSGNFICGSNTIEGDAVTKPTRAGGGVMCCHD